MLPFRHGELVDRQPVIVLRHFKVDQARERAADRSVSQRLNSTATPATAAGAPRGYGDQQRSIRPQKTSVCRLQRLRRQGRVLQSRKGLTKAFRQHHVAEGWINPLRQHFAKCNVRSVRRRYSERTGPGKGRTLSTVDSMNPLTLCSRNNQMRYGTLMRSKWNSQSSHNPKAVRQRASGTQCGETLGQSRQKPPA